MSACNTVGETLVFQDQRAEEALLLGNILLRVHLFVQRLVSERDLYGIIESLCYKCVSEALIVKVCEVVGLVRKWVMRVCFVAFFSDCCVFHCMTRAVWRREFVIFVSDSLF